MFDFHNHFTNKNAVLKTGTLLPQFFKGQEIKVEIYNSEIGLDKRYTEIMNKENQIVHFKNCLNIAKAKNIQIHVHCVGYIQETINCLKEAKLKEKQVIWHRFNCSFEVAKELFKLGVIISISNDFKKDILKLYNCNPLLVLETDYEGNSNEEHENLINENYKRVSKSLNITIEKLEANCLKITKFN